MSDILMTGKSDILSHSIFGKVSEEYRVILTGDHLPLKEKQKNIVVCHIKGEQENYAELFDAYDIQTAFYFSGFLEGGSGLTGEEQMLDGFLQTCTSQNELKVAVFMPLEAMNAAVGENKTGNREGDVIFPEARYLRLRQLEDLCFFYRKQYHADLTVVHIPYLEEAGFYENYLGSLFHKLGRKERIVFPFSPADPIDFLTSGDFAGLILRLADAEAFGIPDLVIGSGYSHTYGELEETLGAGTAEYRETLCLLPEPAYPVQARKRFGWFPKEDGFAAIPASYEEYRNSLCKEKKRGLKDVLRRRKEKGSPVKYLELAVLFVVVELLNRWLGVTVYFKFVDLRLLFVVMMGTIYGMKLGLFASILASAAFALQLTEMGMSYSVLFYNVDNWIPFVAYFMAGSISGYSRNKKEDELHFLNKDYELLRDKYLYLNQMYQDTIANKREYKRQILGYKDSFGKIFNAVQRLDNQLPERIFSEALELFEEQLENRTLAIYSVDRWQKYARLLVSSNAMARRLNRSLALADYPEMMEAAAKGEVFKNTKLLADYPSYASAILKDGKTALLIVVYKASPEQYGMYYMNLFRILTGLMQNAFLHALEYTELAEEKIYDRESHIMKRNRFMELLTVREEMKQKQIADYILLRLITEDRKKTAEALTSLIRSTDILGEGADGQLYLLLAQVDETNFKFVEERLNSHQIDYERTVYNREERIGEA